MVFETTPTAVEDEIETSSGLRENITMQHS
jgi:hypothetical protein